MIEEITGVQEALSAERAKQFPAYCPYFLRDCSEIKKFKENVRSGSTDEERSLMVEELCMTAGHHTCSVYQQMSAEANK